MSSISAGTSVGTALVSTGDTTGSLLLKTNGSTTAVTIDTSQNVGIGTSSPSFGLVVEKDNGSGYAAGFRSASGSPMLTIQNTGGISQIQGLNSALSATANIGLQLSGGNVSIGTTNTGLGKLTAQGTITAKASADESILSISHNGSEAIISASYGSTGSYDPMVFKTSDVERMRIDSSGIVTLPYQPAFQAYCGQNTNSTTAGVVPFNNTRLNVGSHYNTSTYTFTAPVAGSYFFTATIYIQSNSNAYANLGLRKNGATLLYTETSTTTVQLSLTTSMILTLSAGDAVTAGFGNNGSRQYYQGGTETSFSGYLIG